MNLGIGDFCEPDSETLPSDTSEIDYNSKTKSRTKKTHEPKNTFLSIAYLLGWPPLRSSHIYMKDAHSVETTEKSNFQFLRFLFF